MDKYFTIKKIKNSKEQTEKDFETIQKLKREKSFYLPMKNEIILKEQNEIYKVFDHAIVQEDTRKYLTKNENPFESKKLSTFTTNKFFSSN